LPQGRLRAVVDYVGAYLDTGPTLEQTAAIAELSPDHFARRFKAATGLPPHRYVDTRRVERAKQLLQGGGDCALARVAARWFRGPEPILPSLQATCRTDAAAVPEDRKNRLKGRKHRQESGRPTHYSSM
jgi:AraC-like DNA-binding protein